MLYPSGEYTYVDEYGQVVEPNAFNESFYNEQIQENGQSAIYEATPFDEQQQFQYRTVTISNSQPLAKCSVLYLGTAISSPGQRGIDAIQEPLSRRYPVNGKEVVRGIEAWLAIYENGLQLQFARDPSVVVFYPIRSLVYCASIRFAVRTQTGAEFPNGWRFVPLDSPAAARIENTRNPPLFAATFRRTRHLPVDECFCFVTKTKQAALALVQACFSAYQATSPDQDCSKVPLYFQVDDYGAKDKEIDSEIRIVPAPDRERKLDYQTNTEGPGFFYKTDRVLIDTWQLWENHKQESTETTSTVSSSACSSNSSHTTSSSCSSCRNASRQRRRRRRRLASIASIPGIQPSSNGSLSKSTSQVVVDDMTKNNNIPTVTMTQMGKKQVDPYAPAANLVRVERIKDMNSGQDVFIRWVTEDNTATNSVNEDEEKFGTIKHSNQSKQKRVKKRSSYDSRLTHDVPIEIERLALEDEYLGRSLIFENRSNSRLPTDELQRPRLRRKSRKSSKNELNHSSPIEYEVIDGYFEDRNGKKRPIKVDRNKTKTITDYRHLTSEAIHSSLVGKERPRYPSSSVGKSCPTTTSNKLTNSLFPIGTMNTLARPMLPAYIPRASPFYPPPLPTTIFPRPNFLHRMPCPGLPPMWYRPM